MRILSPEFLTTDAGLRVTARRGLTWGVGAGFHLTGDESLNYLFALVG